MIFRRFAVILQRETRHNPGHPTENVTREKYEGEVCLNLSHIVRIIQDQDGNTYISCVDGSLWLSAYDYKTLTDALDGEHRYH